ncbi:sister chromatid cohesion protein PDS5 homolog C-like isoform X2 [Impatiens glandulifera]|uniref:sister chromatid cohesion protein PDS5 homolog C-like isoform X2 n=1 Tax=Impatiens glandulifera TaxID=253017 RepID=UPI001FB1167E|nr:sister chromatid cohesion protein PDS5 homolog C-like isoform X2 [Impatiens glandulifera]
MTSSKTELEEHLLKIGKKLLQPPATVDELLPLLDQAEALLSRVEQSPSRPLQSVLSLSTKALVEDELFRHSDMDVKVAVASCITEITRITAPDAPYDDDKMKDIFQLIVSSFENISDLSSRSYSKRTSILETVAKVRSCVVMLDLECDELINEMFQHFMNVIRDYHPESIFSAMETIMSLVLEESEEISMELIHPILASVKKDNQEILPVARRLGERVIENSAVKLRPYMLHAVKSNWISLDDYSEIISNLCEGISIIKRSNGPASTGQLRSESLLNGSSEKNDISVVGSPKLIPNDDVAESTEEGPESSKKTENGQHADHSVDAEETKKAESGGIDNVDTVDSDSRQEKSVKNNGRNLKKSLTKRTKPSVSLPVKRGKRAEEAVDITGAASEEPSVKEPLEKEAEQLVIEAKDVTDISPSSSQSVPKAKVRQPKKETLSQDIALPAEVSKEHGTSVLEEKLPRSAGKKTSGLGKTEGGTLIVGDMNSVPNNKKTKGVKKNKFDASEKKEGRKRDQEKAIPEKDTTSSHEDDKELISSHKSFSRLPKDEDQINEADKSFKRKQRGSGKDKVTDTRDYGADLVGSKVKVWWPKDKEFYEGVIDAYDPVEKKHKILYNDGDQEELNLKKERWELTGDNSEEQKSVRRGSDLSKMHKKKKPEMDSDQPAAKQENTESSRRDMGSFSSKMKGVAKKLAQNSMDGGVEKKSSLMKSSRVRSDEDGENKSKKKDSSKRHGKSTESGSISRPGGIKKKDGETLKVVSKKVKQDNSVEEEEEEEELEEVNAESTPKGSSKSNGKTAQNSKNRSKGKPKSKEEESESEKESPEMVKELGKRKSTAAAKTSGTVTKRRKKA